MDRVTRRTLLSTAGALAVAPAAAEGGAKSRAKAKAKKATFVLVHGGGHGGWCWKRVVEPLRENGHIVYAPSLTGLADRQHTVTPDTGLSTHVTDIVNLLKWEDLRNIILVGHSYGGLVITGIADQSLDRIGHMVYLDAAHQKNGTALWKRSDTPGGSGGPSLPRANPPTADVRAAKVINGVEFIVFPSEEHTRTGLGVTDPADVAWMMERLTPQPAKTFYEPLDLKNEDAVHKLPTTDIWRKSVLENQQKSGRDFTWAQRIWSIDSPAHDLMITNPKEVTDYLLRVAAL